MIEQIKARCGVPMEIRVYNGEFAGLIADALEDMRTAGVPSDLLADLDADTDPRVLTAVTCYVKAYRGDDRSDTDKYIAMYRAKLHKLMLEPEPEQSGGE